MEEELRQAVRHAADNRNVQCSVFKIKACKSVKEERNTLFFKYHATLYIFLIKTDKINKKTSS